LASFGLIDAKAGKENVARVEVSCLNVLAISGDAERRPLHQPC
jgi:hypothetical protein